MKKSNIKKYNSYNDGFSKVPKVNVINLHFAVKKKQFSGRSIFQSTLNFKAL